MDYWSYDDPGRNPAFRREWRGGVVPHRDGDKLTRKAGRDPDCPVPGFWVSGKETARSRRRARRGGKKNGRNH